MASEPSVAAMQQHQAALRANPALQQHTGQTMPTSSLPMGTSQYSMQPRPNYSLPVPNGVTPAPLSRQLSNHPQMPAHESALNAKISNMSQPHGGKIFVFNVFTLMLVLYVTLVAFYSYFGVTLNTSCFYPYFSVVCGTIFLFYYIFI